jgi:hypothetical protein
MTSRRSSRRRSQPAGTLPTARLEPAPYVEITIDYVPEAPQHAIRERIHPRRSPPVVPQGSDEADPDPSPPTELSSTLRMAAEAGVRALTDELVLVRNIELTSVARNNMASNVGEPSVASNGDVVFYTGNWYAAVSTDGGATFRFVDPFRSFPDPPGLSFCCDQVVQYIPRIDTFVWLLQYSENAQNENIQRLAFAKTKDVQQGRWRLFDISSQSLNLPNHFLDFPDLAVGTNMLYVTTNAFPQIGNQVTSVIVRIPLSSINSGNITAQHAASIENFSFRVAQHCGTRAFWAAHQNTSTLRVFSWRETEQSPTATDVPVARWVGGNGYRSDLPDNRNWLGRADPRITGATRAGNELWFAWGVDQGGANSRPHPYVQIARLRVPSLTLIDNINLFAPDRAFCYAALSSNINREVGTSYMVGGGGKFPTHAVGILTGTRKDVLIDESSRGPSDGQWGDYLTIRRHQPNGKLFAASGFTLKHGAGDRNATPRFVLFGRASDANG